MTHNGSSGSVSPPDNLLPVGVPQVDWTSEKRASALTEFYTFASRQASEAISWYFHAKEKKKRYGQWIRLLALFTATLGSILPTVSQMTTTGGQFTVSPGWATVVLVLAAGLVALDQFYGFTSSWVRYVATAQDLKEALDQFRFSWERERLRWTDGRPSDEQTTAALERFQGFVSQVNQMVRNETNAWIAEFRASLQAIEEVAKTRAETLVQGGANITVAGGEQAPEGWTLMIDDGPPTTYHGVSAAVSNLVPGLRKFAVSAVINNQPREAQKIVSIAANTVTQVDLNLG